MSIDNKRLVQIKIVRINLDFIDCLNASLQRKSTVSSRCLLHIEQHMQNLGVVWRRLSRDRTLFGTTS